MHGIYRETGQHGPYNQAVPVWKAAIAVNCGDLVYRDAADGYDKPAGSFTWDTDLATTQAAFHDVFRGVSMATRRTTQTTDGGRADGCILTTGEFEMPCAALGAAVTPGELVAPAKQSGNLLEPQKVVVTTTVGNAIGVVTEDAPVGQTFLKFKIVPVKTEARGVQAIQ
jgi:hypothetical protein